MKDKPKPSMDEIILADGRYPQEAFAFLHEGLGQSVSRIYGKGATAEDRDSGEQHHVSGEQLCLGLRDVAVERWGLLAKTVLERWNIRATIDFGNMVYLLIESEVWRKTPEDSLEDFRDVYDFETAFALADEFELKE